MKGMLTMVQIQYIKHLRDKKDKSIMEIAETVDLNWRTAKKYADREDWSRPLKQQRCKKRPVMDAFEEIVDTWLMEDSLSPKKQRHTAKRIYDRLVSEHQFSGGQRTVRQYISRRKHELRIQEEERYARLEHPGGEAHADFGTAKVVEQGKLKEIKCLVLSFPFSNAGFPYAVPAENAECFLEALKRLFEHIGAVPQKIWLDNLPAAVAKVLQGSDRKLTEIFERFCLHYRFEPVFCNPGCANEKGHVENKVGFTRRNWFVPLPQFEDWEQLNSELLQKAEANMYRTHYEKGREIAALWAEERTKLLTLPGVPFEVVRLLTATVDKYSRVRFENHPYDVPRARPGEQVLLEVHWDQVEILNQGLQPIGMFGRPYSTKETAIDWVAHLDIYRRKPRALNYSSYLQHLPPALREFFLNREGAARRQRIELVSELLRSGYQIEEIATAVAAATREGIEHDAGGVRHLLYRQTHGYIPETIPDDYTPACILSYAPDMSIYDQLTRDGGGPGGV
ncbi:IS21 family transposase [Dehalococcoidia bacterium]|nr:IS21 family transposase [Dehalococcoidia bacterium]